MEVEIIQDTRNELLSRRELRFVLTHDGPTPSRKEIIGRLCAMKNVGENLAVLDTLSTQYGMTKVEGMLRIYDSEEARNRAEAEYLFNRGQPKSSEEA
ncbi:MAG TPA: 30S ribosomal protein S24e [Methanoregulaceae archaeon]|nr:30S ribosomal protein S24e [Methanoregulaceae archaeon]HOV68356.1 30S ribosomal protein S24e [Methanoregulaceae archaeon]HQJ88111.1 30S ribosomal protein S24e [Methanoregulaceae archaeon]